MLPYPQMSDGTWALRLITNPVSYFLWARRREFHRLWRTVPGSTFVVSASALYSRPVVFHTRRAPDLTIDFIVKVLHFLTLCVTYVSLSSHTYKSMSDPLTSASQEPLLLQAYRRAGPPDKCECDRFNTCSRGVSSLVSVEHNKYAQFPDCVKIS